MIVHDTVSCGLDLDASGKTEELARNLDGAKFTLAVTDAGAALGAKDFADLDAHKDAFGGKIFGIEPGAPANQSIPTSPSPP